MVVRTVDRRGKSLIPVSRIAIEESRREREERNDATEAESEAADEALAIANLGSRVLGSATGKRR